MEEHGGSGLKPGRMPRRGLCGKAEMVRVVTWKWEVRERKYHGDSHTLAGGPVDGVSVKSGGQPRGWCRAEPLGWSPTDRSSSLSYSEISSRLVTFTDVKVPCSLGWEVTTLKVGCKIICGVASWPGIRTCIWLPEKPGAVEVGFSPAEDSATC